MFFYVFYSQIHVFYIYDFYNLGSGSWLAMTVVPRRTQWQPRACANNTPASISSNRWCVLIKSGFQCALAVMGRFFLRRLWNWTNFCPRAALWALLMFCARGLTLVRSTLVGTLIGAVTNRPIFLKSGNENDLYTNTVVVLFWDLTRHLSETH